jgi:hypothetical protein
MRHGGSDADRLASSLDLLRSLKEVADAVEDLRRVDHPAAKVAAEKGVEALLTMLRQIDAPASTERPDASMAPPRRGSRRNGQPRSDAERREIVERARTENNAALAIEIGVSERTIAKWKRKYLPR